MESYLKGNEVMIPNRIDLGPSSQIASTSAERFAPPGPLRGGGGPPQAIDVTSILPTSAEGVSGPPQAIDVTRLATPPGALSRAEAIQAEVMRAADRYRALGPEASEKQRAAAMSDYRTALQEKAWGDRDQAMAEWRNKMVTRTDYDRFLLAHGENLGVGTAAGQGAARIEAEDRRIGKIEQKEKAGEELAPGEKAQLAEFRDREAQYRAVPAIGPKTLQAEAERSYARNRRRGAGAAYTEEEGRANELQKLLGRRDLTAELMRRALAEGKTPAEAKKQAGEQVAEETERTEKKAVAQEEAVRTAKEEEEKKKKSNIETYTDRHGRKRQRYTG
jgi:hypothetical protein